jgi:DNA-binding CsgD family transcriptional regulator
MNTPTTAQMIGLVLKDELRRQGIRNRDVASRLEVSETTVKRYLRGQGLDVSVLEKLTEMANLELLSLLALVQQRGSAKPRLSAVQQEALAKSQLCRTIFFFLHRGLTLAQICKELEITPQRLDAQLLRLENWRLIRKLPNNQIETLAVAYFDPKDRGPLMSLARDLASRFLLDIDLRSESCDWFYVAEWLSQTSIDRVREMLKRFSSEIYKLGAGDMTLSPREAKYYQVFIATQPTSRKRIPRAE